MRGIVTPRTVRSRPAQADSGRTTTGEREVAELLARLGKLTERGFAEPANPAEKTMTSLWADLLELPRVGAEDDFFALGGHSLLATRLISRIRRDLGAELPLSAVFEDPTPRALARRLALAQHDSATDPRPRPLELREEAPLSLAQERLWFFDRLFGRTREAAGAYVMPSVVRLGAVDQTALRHALADLVTRHEALRTRIQTRDGTPRQRILEPAPVPLPIVDLEPLEPNQSLAETRRQAVIEARRTFDLESDSLLRAVLLRRGIEDHVLLLTMHHIGSDGWSMEVLERDLRASYSARREGRSAELPRLTLHYADYAVWQRQRLQGELLESETEVWRRRLDGAPSALDLPYDRPPGENVPLAGGTVVRELDPALADGLRQLAREHRVSFFIATLAAFQALLHRWTGQDDLTVGSPVSRRERAEFQDLIGLFVNTLVLRSRLSAGSTFAEHLAAVRENYLEAYAHQEVPF